LQTTITFLGTVFNTGSDSKTLGTVANYRHSLQANPLVASLAQQVILRHSRGTGRRQGRGGPPPGLTPPQPTPPRAGGRHRRSAARPRRQAPPVALNVTHESLSFQSSAGAPPASGARTRAPTRRTHRTSRTDHLSAASGLGGSARACDACVK
jgi:hypothetical protein